MSPDSRSQGFQEKKPKGAKGKKPRTVPYRPSHASPPHPTAAPSPSPTILPKNQTQRGMETELTFWGLPGAQGPSLGGFPSCMWLMQL